MTSLLDSCILKCCLCLLLQCVEPVHLQTLGVSPRQTERKRQASTRCLCCRSGLDPKVVPRKQDPQAVVPPQPGKALKTRGGKNSQNHRPAPEAGSSRKRKRTSVVHPPAPQQPSRDVPTVTLKKRDPHSPEELPVCSSLPRPQTSTASVLEDIPLRIHHHSVEEYQSLYHHVVDGMCKFQSGRERPYSRALGLRIKQQLWERLGWPTFTETQDETGLVQVNVEYGVGVCPPLYNVDISEEPSPTKQPRL